MTTAAPEADEADLAIPDLADLGRPDEEDEGELLHGYPPPVRPPGTPVVAYCGVRMVVRGESADTPPPDTCPVCVGIWQNRRAFRS